MKNLFSLKLANQLLAAVIVACSGQSFAQTEEEEVDQEVDMIEEAMTMTIGIATKMTLIIFQMKYWKVCRPNTRR